ncbi:TPA: 50S ribosomal protein L18 [Candidatus Woesearchaeota archaeon]|nr:50S ribosomal protein L18P [uncultured archaeon]HIG98060.1 50S ribosomal protein L18 [Candidatus Woesearchaeota archaeon]
MKSVIAVPFARKLSGRTNYKRRLALIKSGMPRIVVRKTLTRIILQVVDFDTAGDRVRVTITSDVLKKLGWKHSCKNIPAAYLAGMLAGKAAVAANIVRAVPDLGFQTVTRGGKVFAALLGARDAGLDVPVSVEITKQREAISGARIAAYATARHMSATAGIEGDFEKLKAAIAAGKGK